MSRGHQSRSRSPLRDPADCAATNTDTDVPRYKTFKLDVCSSVDLCDDLALLDSDGLDDLLLLHDVLTFQQLAFDDLKDDVGGVDVRYHRTQWVLGGLSPLLADAMFTQGVEDRSGRDSRSVYGSDAFGVSMGLYAVTVI